MSTRSHHIEGRRTAPDLDGFMAVFDRHETASAERLEEFHRRRAAAAAAAREAPEP